MEKIQYQKDNIESAMNQKPYVAPFFRCLGQNVGTIDVLAQASNLQSDNFESGWLDD